MVEQFQDAKSLKAWFKSLGVEDKKAHGKAFNERMATLKGDTKPSRPVYKPPWEETQADRDRRFNETACHRCGSIGCHCWKPKVAAKGTEDVGGYPPNPIYATPSGSFFEHDGRMFIKRSYKECEELDTGRVYDLGEDWWDVGRHLETLRT